MFAPARLSDLIALAQPRKRLVGSLGVAALITLGLNPSPVFADVLISQVYGGGGNAGAFLKNDYVELINTGSSAVSLNGWSVQYGSSAGDFGAGGNLTTLSGVVQAGEYVLVQEAPGTAGTTNLPTPDDSGLINLSAINGKVALVDSTTALGCGGSDLCSAEQDGLVLDLVGYGSANDFEGSGAAPAIDNAEALFRINGGCTDTNNNAADFVKGAPNPRNSASTFASCPPSSTPPTSPTGTTAVPEPLTIAIFGAGLAGAFGTRLRKAKRRNLSTN